MKKLLLATAAACALAGGIALFSGCAEETYEVTFLPDGGQLSTEQTTIEVSAGEAIEALPDAEKFGYEFLGWYDGDILAGQAGQSYTPDESVELTAKWNEVESDYTVRYVLNAENTTDLYTYPADSASGTAAFNGTVTVTGMPSEAYISAAPTAPTREGYHFAGWHTEADIGEEDIVHGVSKYLWMFGEKLSVTGKSKLESMSDELIEQRQISEEVMLIDSADDNGTLTLYARWVKEKEISDEEGLKSIADDLYGAYILTDDITLTDDWDMIGAYFINYEYYETEWWTYAFRGTLNGNGKKISGLNITTASFDRNYGYEEGTVWHDDGVHCNGTASMFGAMANATVSNLTFVEPQIDVNHSGDYLYAGVLASFDMASNVTNVAVQECNITIQVDEEQITYRDNIYTAVSGLTAGGWTAFYTNCSVSGDISLTAASKVKHGGEIYLGGMFAEGYSFVNGGGTDVNISLVYNDEVTQGDDAEIVVNVGGFGGSGLQTAGLTVDSTISVEVNKPEGRSVVNIGGIVGAQRYFTASGCTVNSSITTNINISESQGALNIGKAIGRIDVYYLLQILAYTPVVNTGAENNTCSVTADGQAVEVLIADALNAFPGTWYIANGDYEVSPGYTVPSNIEEIVEVYGSYMPIESLQNGIIYITNTDTDAQ